MDIAPPTKSDAMNTPSHFGKPKAHTFSQTNFLVLAQRMQPRAAPDREPAVFERTSHSNTHVLKYLHIVIFVVGYVHSLPVLSLLSVAVSSKQVMRAEAGERRSANAHLARTANAGASLYRSGTVPIWELASGARTLRRIS